MSDVLKEFLSQGRKHFSHSNMLEWAQEFIWIETKSGRWEKFKLDGHEPLREIYMNSSTRRVTVPKAAQLGVSTLSTVKSMFLGDKYGISTGYYFPTDTDVRDFVDQKFDRVVENSEYLSKLKLPDDIDNKGLKQFSRFAVFFRGTESKRKVKSITVGHIVKDELDEANQENMKFADDRMLHQGDNTIITELSQPSEEDYGIDAAFKVSDMSYWGVKCGCGHWNFPDKDFPENVFTRGNTVYLGCVKCSKKLNVQHSKQLGGKAQWVAEHPERSKEHRGFQLSHLIFDVISTADIKKRWDNANTSIDKKNFSISILGRAYSTAKTKPVTDEILNNAERYYAFWSEAKFSYFGMDVGDMCHLSFYVPQDNGKMRLVNALEIPADKEAEIIQTMRRFGVYSGVIDAMPFKTLAKNIAREFPGRVAINYYKGDTLRTGTEGEGQYEVKKTTIDRNESIDETISLLHEGRIELPSRKRMSGDELSRYEKYRAHLKQLIKEQVDRNDGSHFFQYKKNVENHWGMSLNYARIARDISQIEVITNIAPLGIDLNL